MVAQLILMLNTLGKAPPIEFPHPELAGSTIERILFEDRAPATPPHWAHRENHSYTARPDDIELYVTEQPHPRAIVQPQAHLDKLNAFHGRMGRLHYRLAPQRLVELHGAVIEHLGLPRSDSRRPRNYHMKAYQPDGVWEWIPPEHPWDWRARARWLIPVDPTSVSMTKLALAVSGYMERARVTIDYIPRSSL